MTAVQVNAEVLTNKKVGSFQHLTLLAPGVAEGFRPGALLAVTVGGPLTERLARRTFPIYRARASAYGGTVELVFEPREPGETWLAGAHPNTRIDVLGPLGRPFALPKEAVPCVLVGYAADAAPLLALAERLRERRCDVHVLLGAPGESRVFGALDARRSATSVTVCTEDGSLGTRGSAVTALPDVLSRRKAAVVYAAGPHEFLHAVSAAAEQHGAWSQTAVRVPMPCGTGLCNACVVPVAGADGVVRRVRACTEGPVLRGDRVAWQEAIA